MTKDFWEFCKLLTRLKVIEGYPWIQGLRKNIAFGASKGFTNILNITL